MAIQQPNLQPPSFFQSPPEKQRTPEVEACVPPSRLLQDLCQQNEALRENLEAYQKMASKTASSEPSQFPPLLTPAGARIPHLASDLLHVEECLQSKMKLLDAEKKEAWLRVVQLEKDLQEQNGIFVEEKDNLLREHKMVVTKLQCELHDLTVDFDKHRGNMAAQVKQLETQLQQAHQQKVVSVQELHDKLEQLQLNYHTLQVERDGQVEKLSIELSDKKRQLEVSEEAVAREVTDYQTTIKSLKEEVQSKGQKVQELEAYLGGEIPDLASGKTWAEERQLQACQIEKVEHENQKLISESKLLNIRLDSISEILSIQDEEVTKRTGKDRDAFQSLLTLWRNKVFALLIQRKLQDIQVAREVGELRRSEADMKEELEKRERQCQLLSGLLSDREAQLQLGTLRAKEAAKVLEDCERNVHQLEQKLLAEQACRHQLRVKFQSFAHSNATFKSLLHRALTQLVNYDQRIALLSGHVQSVTASLECRHVASTAAMWGQGSDVGCQVGVGLSEGSDVGVVFLTREQLEHEMCTLRQERDLLVGQLRDCSKSFQDKVDKEMSEKINLREQLRELEQQCSSLTSSLDDLRCEMEACKAHNQEKVDTISTLEENLKQVESKAEAKLEKELSACCNKNRTELSEMEKLLTVARREHSKAVMDVQQLTRQLARDQDLVREAAQVDSQRLQLELAEMEKKLHTALAEKNLILATLRDEGIAVPRKCGKLHPLHIGPHPPRLKENTADCVPAPQPPIAASTEAKEARKNDCNEEEEDIRDVLKDLQLLSASLLSMEKEQNTTGVLNTAVESQQ